MLVIWIAWSFAILYACLQGYYLYHWHKTAEYSPSTDNKIFEKVSVVIIARNESAHIQACIKSILNQSLSNDFYEIIIIDDHSKDDTFEKVCEIANDQIQYFRLKDYPEYIYEPAYKKSGITLAVDQAKYNNIVVTDADCIHDKDWLDTTLRSFVANDLVFQTGPVILTNDNSLLEKMQEVEQLVLMLVSGAGITSGWHDIASGANMIFSKEAFKNVNGYESNYQYASGDDMFLIEKMRTAYPNQVSFLKSTHAVVRTDGKKTWNELIRQRLRWAGKNKGLKSKMIKNIWSFVGLYHFFLAITFVTAVFALTPWKPFLILLIIKWLADYFVINHAATFFKRADLVRLFVTLQILYFFYILRLSLAMLMGKREDWGYRRGEE